MAMRMKLAQKLAQKMALTPQMRQSIHILQLPILELKTYLEQQIEENPTLEDGRESELKDSLQQDQKIDKLMEQMQEYRSDSESLFNAGFNREEMQKKQDFRESRSTR